MNIHAKIREDIMTELRSEYLLIPKKKKHSKPNDEIYMVLNSVVALIEAKRGHTLYQLRSKDRSFKIPESRHIFFWMVNSINDEVSWTTMGLFINKDHATALYGQRNVENWMAYDKAFREHVGELCSAYVDMNAGKINCALLLKRLSIISK